VIAINFATCRGHEAGGKIYRITDDRVFPPFLGTHGSAENPARGNSDGICNSELGQEVFVNFHRGFYCPERKLGIKFRDHVGMEIPKTKKKQPSLGKS
jgi:hypothetical protein